MSEEENKEDSRKVADCPYCGTKLIPEKDYDPNKSWCPNPECPSVTCIEYIGLPDPLYGNK